MDLDTWEWAMRLSCSALSVPGVQVQGSPQDFPKTKEQYVNWGEDYDYVQVQGTNQDYPNTNDHNHNSNSAEPAGEPRAQYVTEATRTRTARGGAASGGSPSSPSPSRSQSDRRALFTQLFAQRAGMCTAGWGDGRP